jgi:hypothetical protein
MLSSKFFFIFPCVLCYFHFSPIVLHDCMIPGAHDRGPRTAPQSEQSATLPGGGAGAATTSGYMARPPTVPPARPPQSGSQGLAHSTIHTNVNYIDKKEIKFSSYLRKFSCKVLYEEGLPNNEEMRKYLVT